MSYAKTHLEGYLIQSFYLSPKESDFTVVVDGHRLSVHKLVLSRKSIVFKKMFFGNFKESNDSEIEIKDINFEAFQLMLKYCYKEDLRPSDWSSGGYSVVIEVFKCAHLYQIKDLCLICELKLVGLMSVSNIIEILEFGLFYRLKRIKVFAEKFAKYRAKDLMASEVLFKSQSIEITKILFKSIRFETKIDSIKTLLSIIERNTEWKLNQFFDCIQMEELSMDALEYIRIHFSNDFPEMALKRIQRLEEMVDELKTERNQLQRRSIPSVGSLRRRHRAGGDLWDDHSFDDLDLDLDIYVDNGWDVNSEDELGYD